MVAAPCRCTASASLWKCGITASDETSIWPKAAGESGETVDEPPNIVSASPPLAFSAW